MGKRWANVAHKSTTEGLQQWHLNYRTATKTGGCGHVHVHGSEQTEADIET